MVELPKPRRLGAKNVPLAARVPPSLMARVERYAKVEKASVSESIRVLLEYALTLWEKRI